jgi:hypothetical protein
MAQKTLRAGGYPGSAAPYPSWLEYVGVALSVVWLEPATDRDGRGCADPLAVELILANRGDSEVAPLSLRQLPREVRYMWGGIQ